MKFFVRFPTAPVRALSRCVALLAVAMLLMAAWGVAAYLQTAQVARDVLNGLTVSAASVATSIDVPLGQFADATEAIRATDLQGDKVALTSRILRLQSALPPVGATFAVGASGQLLASSAPFTTGDTAVGDADWFRRAIADNAPPLSLQRTGSWLRSGPSMIVTRLVRDALGKPAGLIGAVFRLDDLTRLTGHASFMQGAALELTGIGGSLPLPARDPATPRSEPRSDPEALQAFIAGADRLLGIPPVLSVSSPLRTLDASVTAEMDTDVAMRSHWLDMRGIGILGVYLSAVLLACTLLAASFRWGARRPGPAPAGFGADWSVELDRRGRIVGVQGYAPEQVREAIDQPLVSAVGEASRPAIAEALEHAGRKDNLLVGFAGQDGQERVHRLVLAPLPDGRTLGSGRDVTEEMRLQTMLEAATTVSRAAQAQVAAVERDRDRVLAALGHDVRTPMNSIMGICSLLLESELEQDQRLWLERIRSSCDTLLSMLNGLLEIAGCEVGSGGLQTDEVDMIGLVQEVTETLQPEARDKGLELKTRFDDLLRGHWLVDPTRLRQVLFNLIGNAIKFTASGHVEVRASAVADQAGRTTIKLAVSDTGPGIAPDERALIFERFRRGRDQAEAGHPGLGLGLSLCRENAALMGGSLTLESALGVGSEFTFEFPAERIVQTPGRERFAGRTALLVGDDDVRARTIAGQLGDAGVIVETAPDGYIGLAVAERIEAQRGALDLVVVEDRLEGMAADAFVLRLRNTVFAQRTVVIWLGDEDVTGRVDATLPAAADPYQVASLAQQLLAQRSPIEALRPMAPTMRGGRILVVEDDKVNQALLVTALARRGFTAFAANDGDDAVRLAAHDSFDAILMDIQMPHRDGFAAARKIRAMSGRGATIPIIALTGLKGPVLRKRCAEAGFNAVLEKPVNLDRLGATLRRWLWGGARVSEQRDVASAADPIVGLADYASDVSQVFLEEMVAVVGIERARACVADFVANATSRCLRLGELLPGWEAGAIVRSCKEISELADTCGAVGLGDVLEEIADAVTRQDRSRAEALIERLQRVTVRLAPALEACLDDIAQRWKGSASKAA
ncbi:MAG TPA: ATP-binding protein [Acetobacteraceae bacterium]|nr:ATP-binding protein [Acetobacteraceae bacterium]